MTAAQKLFRWIGPCILMVALLACQSESGQPNSSWPMTLDAHQASALQQWMLANGWAEGTFQFGSEHHQGMHSVLTEQGQVVAIKAKGVTTTAGLASLTSLRSLELSIKIHAQLSECPTELQSLRINGQPTEPLSLGFLQQCHKLTELKLFHAPIKDWDELPKLSELQSLSLRYGDLSAIQFEHSWPQLKRLNLTNNRLDSLVFLAPQTRLKELFLSHNKLRILPDLSTLSALETLSVDNNPLQSLSVNQLPAPLKNLDLRATGLLDLTPLVDLPHLQKLQVQRRPNNLPATLNDKVLAAISDDSQHAIAEDLMQKYLDGVQFIEKLPESVNGKALGLSKESTQHFSMSGTSKLSGNINIEEVQGLMRIPLAQTDNLLYMQRQVSITGQASVSTGVFRIYSPVELDFWSMAAVFVDHPQPNAPASSDLQRTGFIVYETQADKPVSFQANLLPVADRYLLLVGSDVATGVKINYE